MNDATTICEAKMTVGLDLGDRHIQLCALSPDGEVIEESRLSCREKALRARFEGAAPVRLVLEAGTHSPWVSRLLAELGHEVIVANPRKLRLIYMNDSKSDRVDAEYLARVGRLDPALLSPIMHREASVQADLVVVRSRDVLVRTRTALINHVRGSVKSLGGRIPSSSAAAFSRIAVEHVPECLTSALLPVLTMIGDLSERIGRFDREIERLCSEEYPECAALSQPAGVGPITALTYALTIQDPSRFPNARAVGSYLGLRPKRSQSGASAPELGITKAGDVMTRRLLVGSAQYILGPFGPDTDLRRWGLTLAGRGGKAAKKRAVVAVARKLSVLMFRLWVTGEVYEPLRNSAPHEVEAVAISA